MIRFRRRARPAPGVRVRISTINGVVLETDSQNLHYAAKYGAWRGYGEPCTPACPAGCDKHGWLDLIAGGDHGTTEFTTVPVKIEVKPVMLSG